MLYRNLHWPYSSIRYGKGLILWTNVGHADGLNGDLVVLAPPFAIGEAEIARILETLGQVLCEIKNR